MPLASHLAKRTLGGCHEIHSHVQGMTFGSHKDPRDAKLWTCKILCRQLGWYGVSHAKHGASFGYLDSVVGELAFPHWLVNQAEKKGTMR